MSRNPTQVLAALLTGLLTLVTISLSAAQEQQSFEDILLRWNQTLDTSEEALTQPGLGKAQLRPLVGNVNVVKESALIIRSNAEKALKQQRILLDALGPAPEENDAPESNEIASSRASFVEKISFFDGRVKQCNLVLARADALLRHIADVEYDTLASALYERTPIALRPSVIANAISQFPRRLQKVSTAVAGWPNQIKRGRGASFSIAVLVLVAIWAITFVLARGIQQRFSRDTANAQPTSSEKCKSMLVEILTRVLLPVLALGLSTWIALTTLGVDEESKSIIKTLAITFAQFILIFGISSVTLTPNFPQWRISQFTHLSAESLWRSTSLFAVALLTVRLVMTLFIGANSGTLEAPNVNANYDSREFVSLLALISLIVIALLSMNVLRMPNWIFADAESGPTGEQTPPIYKFILNVARAALVVSIVLGVTGYLNFGLFVLTRTIWILFLIGGARLLHGFLTTILTEATSDQNKFGARVSKHLNLTDTGGARYVFWITLLFDFILFLIGIPLALLILGMSWNEIRPVITDLVYGMEIGNYTISLIDIGIALGIFFLILLCIRLFQRFLSNRVLVQTSLDVGVRDALTSGIGYAGIFVAVLFALTALGLKLGELAIIFGALSVGIGFGLQHVVNNFISGLILLVQRPIKAGDWVVVGDKEGYVKRVRVITTEIQTFDNASLIVPNSDLVSSQVLNWYHKNRLGRVIVPIGVAYGSDPEQVETTLLECAKEIPEVLSHPSPRVIFKDFGDSALLFELRFYLKDMDYYWTAGSGIRFAIAKAFKEAGIEIPFPQRDVHIRSQVESGGLKA